MNDDMAHPNLPTHIGFILDGHRRWAKENGLPTLEGHRQGYKKDNTGGTLALCLNYGGQQEIVDATKALMRAGADPDSLTIDDLTEQLYEPQIPPVDLIIRSSGEQRLSGFMLWRAAYSELYFSEKNWPDFTTEDFDHALADYASRQRRYGE